MGKYIYCCLFLAASQMVFAENKNANINKGNLAVSGTASVSYTPVGTPTYFYGLGASTQYFAWDKLALGGVASYYNGAYSSGVFSVGPAVTFFFWTQDQLAAFLEEDLTYTPSYAPSPYWTCTTKLGLNYFINPSVAVGPALQYVHPVSTPTFQGTDYLNLLGSFSIFL